MRRSCRSPAATATHRHPGLTCSAAPPWVSQHFCVCRRRLQAGDPARRPNLSSISTACRRARTFRIMRDNGKFLSGRKLNDAAAVFLGRSHQPLRAASRFNARNRAAKKSLRCHSSKSSIAYDVADVPMKYYAAKCAQWAFKQRSGFHQWCWRPPAGVGAHRKVENARHYVPWRPHPHQTSLARWKAPPTRKPKASRSASEHHHEVKEIDGVYGIHVMAYPAGRVLCPNSRHDSVASRGAGPGRKEPNPAN